MKHTNLAESRSQTGEDSTKEDGPESERVASIVTKVNCESRDVLARGYDRLPIHISDALVVRVIDRLAFEDFLVDDVYLLSSR